MPTAVKIRVEPDSAHPETIGLAQQTLEGNLIDISCFGVGILLPVSIPPGTLVEMEIPRGALPIPLSPPPKGTMRMTGRVIHLFPQADKFRIGIALVKVDEVDQFLFEKLTPTYDRRRAPRTPIVETQ